MLCGVLVSWLNREGTNLERLYAPKVRIGFLGFYSFGGEEEEDPYAMLRVSIDPTNILRVVAAYLAPTTVVLLRSMNFSSIRYNPPGNRPNASLSST